LVLAKPARNWTKDRGGSNEKERGLRDLLQSVTIGPMENSDEVRTCRRGELTIQEKLRWKKKKKNKEG